MDRNVDLNQLDTRGGEWLRGAGNRSDIVISSRVRLARNLAGYPFLARANEAEQREIMARTLDPLEQIPFESRRYTIDLEDTDQLLNRFLVERHLISRELEQSKGPRAVVFGSNERVSVMVNEEDHLRIQSIRSSLSLRDAYGAARDIDRELEGRLEFAASNRYGYLTACPTNVGTGLRASVMLHLPALVYLKEIEKVFKAAHKTGLTVRGFYGEGTMASGDLYQVSNQVTLGRTEEEILKDLESQLPKFLEYEELCRKQLETRGRLKLEDKCHRALGVLRNARVLSSEEAMRQLSSVRLGVISGVIDEFGLARVNELFVLTQPAHLQKTEGRRLEPEDRDQRRASFVRACLA